MKRRVAIPTLLDILFPKVILKKIGYAKAS
jgi:hypothetical protein